MDRSVYNKKIKGRVTDVLQQLNGDPNQIKPVGKRCRGRHLMKHKM